MKNTNNNNPIQRVKMFKAKKHWVALGTTLAVASVIGTTGAVHADEVTPATTATPDTTAVQENTPTSTSDSTKVNTDDQKAAAKTYTAEQQAAIDKAQKNVDDDKSAIDSTQKDLDNAKKDQSNQQTIVDQNQKDVDQAQDALNAAKDQQTKDQDKADQLAPDGYTDAEKNVDQAQKDTDQAQKTVNTDQINVDTSSKDIKDTENKINNKTSELNNAKNDVVKDQEDVKSNQKDVDQAQKKNDSDKENVNTAKNQVNHTANKIDDLTNELNSINTIALPKDYVDTLTQYNNLDPFATDYDAKSKDLENKLITIAQRELKKQIYKPSQKDQNTIIHGQSDLTSKLLGELSNYVADLLNPLRAAFGKDSSQPLLVSENAIVFAQLVADNYNNDNWSLLNGHDVPAINKAADQLGLLSGDNYYENASMGYIATGSGDWSISLDDVKGALYNTVIDMIFSQDEWMHANGLLSQGFMKGSTSDNYFFAVNIDNNGIVHLETINNSYVQKHDQFDSNIVQGEKINIEAIKSEISQSKDLLNSQNDALLNAQNMLTNSSELLNKSQALLDSAKNKLNQDQKLVNILTDTVNTLSNELNAQTKSHSDAVSKLDADKSSLEAAKTRLSDAQNNLNSAKQKYEKQLPAYNAAKKVVQDDQAKINDLSNTISALQDKSTKDKSDLASLNEKVSQLKNKLVSLEKQLASDEKVLADTLNPTNPDTDNFSENSGHGNDSGNNNATQGGNNDATHDGNNISSSDNFASKNVQRNDANMVSNAINSIASNQISAKTASDTEEDIYTHGAKRSSFKNSNPETTATRMNYYHFNGNKKKASLNENSKATTLPQTGDSNENSGLISVIGLALATTTFGLLKYKRRHN